MVVEHGKKRLFYTGDINTRESLLRQADLNLDPIDLLIIESTYSQTEQTPREQSESELLNLLMK